jgi:anthranilate synthase component 1
MYYPTIEEFKKLSGKANCIPVYRELPMGEENPISAFRKLPQNEYAYILESVERGKLGHYSFLGIEPDLVLRCKGKRAEIVRGEKCETVNLEDRDPLHLLKDCMSKYKVISYDNLPPFYGGAVGYLSYDTVRFFEKLPDKNINDLGLPDLYFILSKTLIIFDHVSSSIKVVSNAYIEGDLDAAYHKAIEEIDRIVEFLRKETPEQCIQAPSEVKSLTGQPELQSNFSEGDFCKAVELSQRLKTNLASSPFDIYQALRRINPSPYMFYLKFGDMCLVGSSPEILVRVCGDEVTIRPIAGTRKRGETSDEDNELEKELLADEKERAEHLMLVDLGRNDLGRVAKVGTVNVTEFMTVERYSHVMHIVSNVRGELESGRDSFDVLRASFPAGTVSGAPKIRAMEIIDELEPTRRGPYAGAVGYFGFSGVMDTCITIRTVLVHGKQVYVQVGAGIVADSVPEREFQETANKAKALLKALSEAGNDFSHR